MDLNSDAVNNVKRNMVNFESGVIKAATEGVGILSPDIIFSGMVAEMECGETIAVLDFLCYDATANALKKSDADAVATVPCMAIALEAGTDGTFIKVLLWGYLKAAALDFGVRATGVLTVAADCVDNDTFTIGDTVYEISVDGTITEGNIVAGGVTDCHLKAAVGPALVAAINGAPDPNVTAVLTSAFVVTITAEHVDVAATADAIATTTTADAGDATWGATTMATPSNGNKVYASDTAGRHMVAASSTSTEYNQVIGQALSMKELLFKPDNYALVVA